MANKIRPIDSGRGGASIDPLRAKFWDRVSAHYDIGRILEKKRLTGGRVQAPVFIRTSKGAFILKEKRLESPFDKSDTSIKDQIRSQYMVEKYLRQNGFPIACILPSKDKMPLMEHKGRYYVLREFKEGRTHVLGDTEWFRFIAEYHNAIKGFPHPQEISDLAPPEERFGRRWDHFKKVYEKIQGERPERLSELEKLLLEQFPVLSHCLQENCEFMLYKRLPKRIIHGDFGPWNIVVNDRNLPVGLIDPQYSYEPRIGDLTKFRFTDEISENLIITRLRAYQSRVSEKLTKEENISLKGFFIMEKVGSLLWYYETLERKLCGEEIACLDVKEMERQFDMVNKLTSLDWGRIQAALK